MHSLISCLSFLCAATMDETKSVGSETVVMTPLFCMLLSSALTRACIGTRDAVCWTNYWLYSWIQCHGVCDREFSKLVTEHVFVLYMDLFGEISIALGADLMYVWVHCDNSEEHKRTKSQ